MHPISIANPVGLHSSVNYFALVVSKHGYVLMAAAVFAEASGLPIPASLVLIAAGAAVASHALSAPAVIVLAVLALLAGDCLLYTLGRYTGWALLGMLCRLSMNPETCILRSAESFYKRGKMTLLIAKFIPGVNAIAPPLAGSMKMRPWQFLRFDLAGATLYATAYLAVGFIFRDFLAAIMHGVLEAGRAVEAAMLGAVVVYVIYRFWLYRKHSVYRVIPRIQVEELARKLASEEGKSILLVDVRSHGYYDAGAMRIQGSLRIEPNNLAAELKHLPKDKEIYLYCT
jgi:membrane protein DedA with SNARE-associated domain